MDKSQIPLHTLADHYLTACRTEGKTPKTLRGYKEKLSRFVRWLDGRVADFSIQSVRNYIDTLQRTRKWEGHPFTHPNGNLLSAQAVANHVQVLKALSTWLYEEGYMQENVLQRLTLPKVPRKVMPVLTKEEVDRLMASIDEKAANGWRDLVIVALILDAGLRCAELVSLKLADMHLDEQWLKVMGKGQKERIVPFGGHTAKLLMHYVTSLQPDIYPHPELFLTIDGEPISENTIKMLFVRLRKKSGIERLHPHLLRHTFATSYLVAGGDVFTLQNILGHTTLEMTRRYVALASAHVNIQHHRFSPMDRVDVPALRSRGGKGKARRASSAPGVAPNLPLDGRATRPW